MKIGTINVGLFDFIKDLASWKNRASHLSKIVAKEKIDILMLQEVYEIKWNEANDKLKNVMRTADLEEEDYNKLSILRECLPSDYNIFKFYPKTIRQATSITFAISVIYSENS